MTTLAIHGANPATVPETVRLPPLPEKVGAYLSRLNAWNAERERFAAASPRDREAIFVGRAPTSPALDGAERAQVEDAAAALRRMSAPITAPKLALWLGPFNAAACNPQSQTDFTVKVAGLLDRLGDLPEAAFTKEARRRVGGDFFPGPEAIRRAVEPGAKRLRAAAAALAAGFPPAGVAHPPAADDADREAQDRRDWSDPERVRRSIEAARGSPMAASLLRMVEKALRRHAPHLLGMIHPDPATKGGGA